jgi:hypothetical protein
MEMKIANCIAQADFDAAAKMMLEGWEVATGIKNNGITGTQNAVVYHLIKYDHKTEVELAARFLVPAEGEKAIATGIHDLEALQFFDAIDVPIKISQGWIPLSRDHIYAKGGWLVKLKGSQAVQAATAPAQAIPAGVET